MRRPGRTRSHKLTLSPSRALRRPTGTAHSPREWPTGREAPRASSSPTSFQTRIKVGNLRTRFSSQGAFFFFFFSVRRNTHEEASFLSHFCFAFFPLLRGEKFFSLLFLLPYFVRFLSSLEPTTRVRKKNSRQGKVKETSFLELTSHTKLKDEP